MSCFPSPVTVTFTFTAAITITIIEHYYYQCCTYRTLCWHIIAHFLSMVGRIYCTHPIELPYNEIGRKAITDPYPTFPRLCAWNSCIIIFWQVIDTYTRKPGLFTDNMCQLQLECLVILGWTLLSHRIVHKRLRKAIYDNPKSCWYNTGAGDFKSVYIWSYPEEMQFWKM